MVKIATLLLSLACACALVQSTTLTATQVDSLAPVQSRRMLKGGGGGGGGHGGTSGGRPSSGGGSVVVSGGAGVIVGSSVASGAYVGSHPYYSNTNTNTNTNGNTNAQYTGSRGNNNETEPGDIIFAGDGGTVPASAAVGILSSIATVATAVVLVVANAL